LSAQNHENSVSFIRTRCGRGNHEQWQFWGGRCTSSRIFLIGILRVLVKPERPLKLGVLSIHECHRTGFLEIVAIFPALSREA
jgi:hypothetical protein